MNKKVLWLITARSGSKSILHKNIKPLEGMPLLAYRIKSALSIAAPENVWVSTDSEEYAEISQSYGAIVPFLRPPELSGDTASSIQVVIHAMEFAALHGANYDAIGLLEPTSPLITFNQLSEAVQNLFSYEEAENIVACRIARPHSFFVQNNDKYLAVLANRFEKNAQLRRQDRKDEITPSGGFYIGKWDPFLQNKTFYTVKTLSFLVSELNGLEIDEPIDWNWAEYLIKNQIVKPSDIFK